MTEDYIDPQVYDLYDEYCHSQMTRRDFLNRAAALVVVSGSALALAAALLPQYAKAQMVPFTDERIKATWVEYPSPGGDLHSNHTHLPTVRFGEQFIHEGAVVFVSRV